jgi:catechol 2,3-dioxygenase-like lactoylglutathione lyase family enzyme
MIAHTSLAVSDYPRSKAFYCKALAPLGSAALAAGGKNNGEPGYREYWPGYYAAFVLDPDGNNIEAVWYDYSKAS